MARKRTYKELCCDFETTVYDGQKSTEVWASAVVELYTEDVQIFHSIDETFNYFKSLKSNLICYYHNLKFDGSFWLSYLLNDLKLKQATFPTGTNEYDLDFYDLSKMPNNSFSYSISDLGQWYEIIIKKDKYIFSIRDSLKLLPFSVKEIGEAFKTKHRKTEIEYTGLRWAGCKITDEERKYISNDVLVIKEALEIMFSEGHNKLTIGACCLAEYKAIVGKDFYKTHFPDLTEVYIDPKKHEFDNADSWIRKSYKGGWVYVVEGKENKIIENGLTVDVNSLYPSVMHSESGSKYPVGAPKFWTGSEIPSEATEENRFFFIHAKTRFYIKDGYLPFIQIKGNPKYKGTEVLKSSDIKDRKTGKLSSTYTDFNGNIKDTRVDLYFTETEYYLFLEHYNTIDFEIIDGCYFVAKSGIFDEYINKYKEIKMNSTGARRTIAKFFLNNLYGKMAASTDSSFKYAIVKDDGSIGFVGITQNDKTPGYIAIGSAITGYARNFTIRHAQKNYHGVNRGFIYADTDSIHCDLSIDELIDIEIHDSDFNHWKIESEWDKAIFVRAKTYIEHVTRADGEQIEPYYDIKCAGMPEACKEQFDMSLTGNIDTDKYEKYNKEQKQFVSKRRTLNDFTYGLEIFGKLVPKRIPGGVILRETYYKLRK